MRWKPSERCSQEQVASSYPPSSEERKTACNVLRARPSRSRPTYSRSTLLAGGLSGWPSGTKSW